MTGLKIQPGSAHMFEHLNYVVVLIKPWNLGGVQINGGWCPQVECVWNLMTHGDARVGGSEEETGEWTG